METLDDTDLKSHYAAQVAADLERNTKEQQRIRAEITALQEQLKRLETDQTLLLSVQQALGSEAISVTAVADAPASQEAVALPRARKAKDTGGAGAKAKKKTEESAKGHTKRSREAGAPTLRELVGAHLAQGKEPRSAAELTAALSQALPGRDLSVTVVRNTLESLVAKGEAHRTKQQKSVFYTAAAPEPAGTTEPKKTTTD